jgi:hypothetical protein
MQSPHKIKGVETNEFSRFVDHTFATPWETFISDIEKSLRLFNKLLRAVYVSHSSIIELNMYDKELLNLPHNIYNIYDANYLNKKIVLKYLEMEFVIEEFSLFSVASSSQSSWIHQLLEFPSFLLFYYTPNSSGDSNMNMKTTILSAFNIAVKAISDLFLPIFFTMEKFDRSNLSSIRDCIGYRPVRLKIATALENATEGKDNNNNPDQPSNSTALATSDDVYWLRYESMWVPLNTNPAAAAAATAANNTSGNNRMSTNMTKNALAASTAAVLFKKNHPLFYFDGIRKLYQKKIRLLNLEYNPNILEHFYTKIYHYYHFDKKLWISSAVSLYNLQQQQQQQQLQQQQQQQQLIPSSTSSSTNPSSTPTIKYYQVSNPYDYTSSTPVEIIMLANYTQKHFIDILTTLLNCGSYRFLFFDYLSVSLNYNEGKQYSIIDNEAYSTLLPSRQSLSAWKLSPYFKKANYQLIPMNIYNILYFQWKSICIRRLLSMYILSTFVKFDGFDFYHFSTTTNQSANANNYKNLYPDHFLLNTESYHELFSLLNSLSPETKFIFTNMFPDDMIFGEKVANNLAANNSSRSNVTSSDYHSAQEEGDEGGGGGSPRKPHASSVGSVEEGGRPGMGSTSLPTSSSIGSGLNNNPFNAGAAAGGGYSFTQEQQNQGLFQQVFQYLFNSKNDPTILSEKFNEHFLEELAGNKLNYIENWIQGFGILSGLLPLKGPYLLRLWQYCLHELQNYYDNNQMLPWAQKSFGINLNMDTHSDHHGGHHVHEQPVDHHNPSSYQPDDMNEGLYAKSLWTDVLYRKNKEMNVNILLPDIQKPILVQKLMMIFFSILMKKEKNTYEIKLINTSATSPEAEREKDPYHLQHQPSPYISLNNITLFRRVPLTGDILAMQQHMLKKFQFERSKLDLIKEHPLVKYQITIPTLLSDMALFKYYNPNIPFNVFYHWYGLQSHPLLAIENIDEWAEYLEQMNEEENYALHNGEDIEKEFMGRPSQANVLLSFDTIESEKEIVTLKLLQYLAEIYYSTERRSIHDQKPVFSAEKEMGKSLAFLERMSIQNFLLEIMYYSLHFICSFIDQSNNYFNSKKIFLLFIHERLILLKNLLAKFNLIIEMKRKIIPNIARTNSTNNSPVNTSHNPGSGSPVNSSRKFFNSEGNSNTNDNNNNKENDTTSSNNNGNNNGNRASINIDRVNAYFNSLNINSDIASEEIILLIDSICMIIEELEMFYCKLHQLLPMIEMFMLSSFHNCNNNNKTTDGGNLHHIHYIDQEEMINDNILQLILSWIERDEEYSCQYANEVNYIKLMMKTTHNMQQQQQQQTASTNATNAASSANTSFDGGRPTPATTLPSSNNPSLLAASLANASGGGGGNRVQSRSHGDSMDISQNTPLTGSILSNSNATTTSNPTTDHDWYSYDGRELPSLPNTKDFYLYSYAKYPLAKANDTSGKENMEETIPLEPTKLEFSEMVPTVSVPPTIIAKIDKSAASVHKKMKEDIHEFSMVISTDGNGMRLIHEILEIN